MPTLCVMCNAPLPSQKSGMPRISCPGECAKARARQKMREYSREKRAAWRDANRERMAESNREYRRANADKVRAKNLRRRARLLNAFDEDVDLTELFARDGGLCGICREPVDPAIPWPDKRSKTLDHIVPLSRGGRHSWANAQLAHAVCNSRKNDHLLPA